MKRNRRSIAMAMLEGAGLYRTAPRLMVLEGLLRATRPLTRRQLASLLPAEGPNKVTLYRTLDIFVEKGLVHRAFVKGRAWHFELADNCTANQCHPHFNCSSCGLVQCMTDMTIPMASSRHGYIFERQQVRLDGLCPECVSRRP